MATLHISQHEFDVYKVWTVRGSRAPNSRGFLHTAIRRRAPSAGGHLTESITPPTLDRRIRQAMLILRKRELGYVPNVTQDDLPWRLFNP